MIPVGRSIRGHLYQLAVTFMVSVYCLITFGNGVFGGDYMMLNLKSKELTRHRVHLDLCDARRDSDYVSRQMLETNQKYIPNNLLSSNIVCDEDEFVRIIRLEDYLLPTLGISFDVRNMSSRSVLTPKEICQARARLLTHDDLSLLMEDLSRPEGHFAGQDDQLQYVESCKANILTHLEYFKDLKGRCDGQRRCPLFSTIYKLASRSFCEIERWRSRPRIDLTYICLPREASYRTRTVAYRDLSNSISCSPGRLLYIKRVVYVLNDSSSNDEPHSVHSPSQFTGQIDLFENDNDDAEDYSELETDRLQIIDRDSQQRPKLERRYKNFEDPSGASSRCRLAEFVMKTCHSRANCSLSLGRQINEFQQITSCNPSRKSDLIKSKLEIDFLCMENYKMRDTTQFKIELIDLDMKQQVLNLQDYEHKATYDFEQGSIALEQMGAELSRNGCNISHSAISYCTVYGFTTFTVVIATISEYLKHRI